jgi:hypothetical protein
MLQHERNRTHDDKGMQEYISNRKQYLGVTAEVSDLLSAPISSDDDAQLAQRVLVKEASHKVGYDLS